MVDLLFFGDIPQNINPTNGLQIVVVYHFRTSLCLNYCMMIQILKIDAIKFINKPLPPFCHQIPPSVYLVHPHHQLLRLCLALLQLKQLGFWQLKWFISLIYPLQSKCYKTNGCLITRTFTQLDLSENPNWLLYWITKH